MEIDSFSHRLSGRMGMQSVFDLIRRRHSAADQSVSMATVVVVATVILTFFGWLWGKPSSVSLGFWLVGVALAVWLHTIEMRSQLANLERHAIGEAESSGFAIQRQDSKRLSTYSLSVKADSEDWIRSKLMEEFHPDLAGLTLPGGDKSELNQAALEARPETFAWSPGPTVAAIQLQKRPNERLDRATYRTALADRINRLVAEVGEEEARSLFITVERYDPAVDTNDLCQLGQAMLDASNWLNDKVHFPIEGVPVEELEHDPELEGFFEFDDNLEGFLNEVYPIRESGVE